MLKGFKEFILRGNVVELAIAVVMGGAFTAVVTEFTKNVVNPLIACLGGNKKLGFGVQLIAGNDATFMNFGAVITAFINLVMVGAVVYFLLVLPMNKLEARREARRKSGEPATEETTVTEKDLLMEIRDLLAQQK